MNEMTFKTFGYAIAAAKRRLDYLSQYIVFETDPEFTPELRDALIDMVDEVLVELDNAMEIVNR